MFGGSVEELLRSTYSSSRDSSSRTAMRASSGSTTLISIFLLKGALPDKYRERVDSHVTGTVQADVKIHTIIVEKPADDGDA